MRILNTINQKRKNNEGFTLVELMIVVAIIGVLAALSIYGVSKYLANAKTGEARNALGSIAKAAASSWDSDQMEQTLLAAGQTTASAGNQFCVSGAAVPTNIPAGAKYQSAATDWSDGAGWECLRFSMTGPQYYRYTYTSTPTASFAAVAEGDLDADGNTSSFTMSGANQNGQVALATKIIEASPEE